ncbi:hypothetical protein IM763_06885, partial [Atopobiaceae bacterium FL090493]|nr:hypothetical protein [Atopobiaceae bacterium FL090493]
MSCADPRRHEDGGTSRPSTVTRRPPSTDTRTPGREALVALYRALRTLGAPSGGTVAESDGQVLDLARTLPGGG